MASLVQVVSTPINQDSKQILGITAVSTARFLKPLCERGRSPSRTLDTLQRDCDYLQFSAQGGGNIKNAKHSNNVIASPIFNVPLSQVKSKY